MQIEVLKQEKNEIEFRIDNTTVAEILRVYLNKDSGVSLAAWKKEHPSKPQIMIIKTQGKTAKKALDEAVSSVSKDLDKILADFKKMK